VLVLLFCQNVVWHRCMFNLQRYDIPIEIMLFIYYNNFMSHCIIIKTRHCIFLPHVYYIDIITKILTQNRGIHLLQCHGCILLSILNIFGLFDIVLWSCDVGTAWEFSFTVLTHRGKLLLQLHGILFYHVPFSKHENIFHIMMTCDHRKLHDIGALCHIQYWWWIIVINLLSFFKFYTIGRRSTPIVCVQNL
jgi:hypothetical protein